MWVDKTEESRVIGHFVDPMLKLRHAVVLPGLITEPYGHNARSNTEPTPTASAKKSEQRSRKCSGARELTTLAC
ncbi:hypothetical protein ACWEO2_04995 [Nocardia sp. NPDC004278]